MNLSKYIGIPYNLRPLAGCVNCWGLVAMVYADVFGNDIPIFSAGNPSGVSDAFTAAFASGDHGFKKVDKPNNYDVVVFIDDVRKKHEYHCGVYYNGQVLHAARVLGGVVYQSLAMASDGFNRIEFWRR